MENITLRQMLEAGAHFGHKTRYWNPKMAPYIYGKRNGIHIINLEKTMPLFSEACAFVENIGAESGTILFVGTKPAVKNEIKDAGLDCNMPYVSNRWLGGTLTNNETISKSIKKLEDLEPAMKECFRLKEKLVFLDIVVDQDEHVYPMLEAGMAMDCMWLDKKTKTWE